MLANNSHDEETLTKNVTNFIQSLYASRENIYTDGNIQKISKNKKYTSGVLYYYFGCFPNLNRTERAEKLSILFSHQINYLFIYGSFYPLDFRKLIIRDSGFYNYSSFEKSFFPVNKTVFYNTTFEGIEPESNLDAEMSAFDSNCAINAKLKHAIVKGEDNKTDLINFIKSDFITLFSVLYKNRMFVKKSENIFNNKKRQIYPKLSIDDYTSYFIEKGVFYKEKSYSSDSKFHYGVSKPFMNDIRYLITNNNFRNNLQNVFWEFISKHFNIEH